MSRFVLVLLTVLLFSSAAFADTNFVVRSYPLLNPSHESVIQTINELVGTNVNVAYVASAGKIVVTGPSNLVDKVTFLMNEINVPTPNIRIDVSFVKIGKKHDSAASINTSGKVVMKPSGKNTFKVTVDPSVRVNSSSSDSNTRQTLVIRSGSPGGSIFVGQEAPYTDWLLDYARQNQIVQQDFEMVKVGSSLRVEATVVGSGPLINIKLTPELTGLTGKKFQRIQYTGLTTEVTVENGATIPIGGLGKDAQFSDKFLVGVSSSGETEHLNITLTPRIINPMKPGDGSKLR